MRFVVAFIMASMLVLSAFAMDHDGKYAQENPELHQWFENLTSKKGMCCSFADGIAVSDVDVDTYTDQTGTHYKVKIPAGTLPHHPRAEWANVPDDAVITEPNKFKLPVVWPFESYLNDNDTRNAITIRCFIPGAMG